MRRICKCLLLSIVTFASTETVGDTLYLTNGNTLSGTIKSVDGDVLTLDTDYAGTIKIKRAFVESIEAESGFMVIRSGSSVEVIDAGTPERLTLDDVEYLGPSLPHEPTPDVKWSGALDAQLTVRSGESNTFAAVSGVKLVRDKKSQLLTTLTPVSRLQLSASGAYGRSDGALNTQRAEADERYQYYLSERLYLLQLLGAEHDEKRNLELRASGGLGLGYDVVANTRTTFSTDAALSYSYERWEEPTGSDDLREEHGVDLRLGLKFERRFARRSVFGESLDVFNSLDEPGEFRFLNTVSYMAPLAENLFIRVEWRTEYDTDPGEGVEDWDNLFTSGIRYEF